MIETEKNTVLKLISSGKTAEALDHLLSLELPSNDKISVAQIKASFENENNIICKESIKEYEEVPAI